mgnify:CR=1 FL=1
MSLHEYYSNPMDIVQFLEGEKAEKIMLSVLHSAALFHADTGLSPIVKSDKYDSYMLDYFFLVSKVSDFVYDAFLGRDKQLAEDAKNQLAELGISVTTEGADWDTAYTAALSQPLMWGWGAHTPMELYNIYHTMEETASSSAKDLH